MLYPTKGGVGCRWQPFNARRTAAEDTLSVNEILEFALKLTQFIYQIIKDFRNKKK